MNKLQPLNRYQIDFAKEKIRGYFLPRNDETPEQTFARAKAECAAAYRESVRHVETLGWDEFKTSVPEPVPAAYLFDNTPAH